MRMVYKIRVILDAEENVIRDIAIDSTDSLEELHHAITAAFGFNGTEMASFYLSDQEWVQGEEFPLIDMSEVPGEVAQMQEIIIQDVLTTSGDKLIYVYDFIMMWSFFVELIEVSKKDSYTEEMPYLIFSLGELPGEIPEKRFESEGFDLDDDDDDDFDMDEY